MKKKYWVPVASIVCGLAALFACQLENKADPDAVDAAYEALYSQEFIEAHNVVETQVREEVQAARNAAASQIVTACCWAVGANPLPTDQAALDALYAQLAPGDEQVINSWGDMCPPIRAFDNNNSTWWNMNYMRSSTNKKHTGVSSVDGGNHWITIKFSDTPVPITGFTYRGRSGNENSRIANYEAYVSETSDLGHNPPVGKKVHTGTFANNGDRQSVTFSTSATGQYFQLRVLTSVNDSGRDGGAAELTITTASGVLDANTTVTPQLDAAEQVKLQDYSNTIDVAPLREAFTEAAPLLVAAKSDPVKFNKLNTALNGVYNSDGTVAIKGAAYYMNEENRPAITDGVTVFFGYQKEVDNLTLKIHDLIRTVVSSR